MHPVIAVAGLAVFLSIGFYVIYQVAKHHDEKNDGR